jgi:curved DNA-binding protein CbpA
MDPYYVLGVDQAATAAQLKAAYRRISGRVHPDKGGSAEAFRMVKEAYDVLSDPDRRKRYDATGRTRPSPVTPERMSHLIKQIIKQVVAAVDADDPTRANIPTKIIQSIKRDRGGIKDKLFMAQCRLERATRLAERFKTDEGFNPVGEALVSEILEIKDEVAMQEDALEMSEELERIFQTYTYNVGSSPEGQHDEEPTTIRVFLGGMAKA